MTTMRPLNRRQLKFVEGIAAGLTPTEAYVAAGYRANARDVHPRVFELRHRPNVAARLREVDAMAIARTASTREHLIDWLWTVINTPVGEIDETHPLAQEVVHDYRNGGITRSRVKSVGKMDAAKLLTSLFGWAGPEKDKSPINIQVLMAEAFAHLVNPGQATVDVGDRMEEEGC